MYGKIGRNHTHLPGIARIILLLMLALTIGSHGFAPSESLAASKTVKLNYKSKSVVAGKEFTLKLLNLKKTEIGKVKYKTKSGKTKYKKAKTYPKITWTSSDPAVARVKNGKVTTIRYGTATVTAEFKRKKDKKTKTYTCKITVKRPNYTVDPTTEPLPASNYTSAAAFNDYTKHYYMLRSYVEDLETRGGGTLTLTPGTYSVTNAVYIPSNTQVYLNDGVLIQNANMTYTSKLTAAKTVFHFCDPSMARAAARYTGSKLGEFENGYTDYNGVYNSAIIGAGSATIDMMGVANQHGVLMVHANNILVQGVNFTGLQNGHGIELNASANVTVQNCTFTGDALSTSTKKEGINIDSVDLATGGINVPYASYDLTACSDITVGGCTFTSLPRAIGTHTYSYGSPHLRINITGNTIQNTFASAIGTMYWQDSVIQGNTVDGVLNNKYGISGEGTVNLTVTGNTFKNMFRIAEFFVWEGSDYPPIEPVMSDAALNAIIYNNSLVNVTNENIRLMPDYDSEVSYFPPAPAAANKK